VARNVGTLDAVVRTVIGLAMAFAGLYTNSWWGVLAIVPLLTATIRWCPSYKALGICTARDPNHNRIRPRQTMP
jgi:hypothetical protein